MVQCLCHGWNTNKPTFDHKPNAANSALRTKQTQREFRSELWKIKDKHLPSNDDAFFSCVKTDQHFHEMEPFFCVELGCSFFCPDTLPKNSCTCALAQSSYLRMDKHSIEVLHIIYIYICIYIYIYIHTWINPEQSFFIHILSRSSYLLEHIFFPESISPWTEPTAIKFVIYIQSRQVPIQLLVTTSNITTFMMIIMSQSKP